VSISWQEWSVQSWVDVSASHRELGTGAVLSSSTGISANRWRSEPIEGMIECRWLGSALFAESGCFVQAACSATAG
jgi:hypothetical protein